MYWLIVYDITKDTLRGKVSERLKDYGLERIQYSSFIGELAGHSLDSLKVDLRRLLNKGDETDSIIIFPLCNSCFNNRTLIGEKREIESYGEKVTVF